MARSKLASTGMEIHTEDGYTFFLLNDGRVADAATEDEIDQSWDSLHSFLETVDARFTLASDTYKITLDPSDYML